MKTISARTIASAVICMAFLIVASGFAAEDSFGSTWPSFRGNDENNAVMSYETPTEQMSTEPVFVRKFGESVNGMGMWNYSPNIPLIVDGDMITTSSKQILRIDSDTGKTIKSGTLDAATNWGYTSLTYAEIDGTNVILCPLGGGMIEAVNADTLEIMWKYDASDRANKAANKLMPRRYNEDTSEWEEVKNATHQSLSPITYSDGIVYTGFYAGYDMTNYYVAVAAREMTLEDPETHEMKEYKPGDLIWKLESPGGFYWNGAVVIGNAVIVGTQDGMNNNDVTGASGLGNADSSILAFDKKTGALISEITLTDASDICSTIVWDKEGTGRLFWTSCGGMLHSAAVNTTSGEISDVISKPLDTNDSKALTVNTPVVYKGRVYLGYKAKGAYGYFAAYDAGTLDQIYKAPLRGYPKSSPMITTAYEGETGYLYAYTGYYEEPGGMQVIRFRADSTAEDVDKEDEEGKITVNNLFDANGYEQYAAGSPIADDKGRIYYKNDSNSLFSIGKCAPVSLGNVSGLKLKPSGTKVTVTFNKAAGANEYRVLYRLNNKGSFKVVMSKTNKCVLTVPNSSVVTVRVRPEHNDAAKKLNGTYTEDVSTYTSVSTIKKLIKGKKAFTVKFDKHVQSDGYQIQYSLKKSMKSKKTLKKAGYSTIKYKVKKLKSKKKYYVRVRSYRRLNGKTLYGSWSKIKAVKTK